MKNLFIAALVFSAIQVTWKVAGGQYTIIQRDANSRVWARTNVETSSSGQVVTNLHKFTELATGLYYTNNLGELVESKEQIDILPEGGASATQGRHQVYFPADIYDGVLEVITLDGRHLQSRPLGVSYDDGSNSVWIGTLKHSVGLLVGANQVMYPDAFTDFKADILCTYRRGGFECDLVLREKPPTPDAYGLDSASSTLQLFTEFFNTEDPAQIPSVEDEWYGLQDHTLKFGKLRMGHGKAFELGTQNANRAHANSGIPVYKTWANISGRKFLVEQVPLDYVAQDLNALPPATNTVSLSSSSVKFASVKRVLPPARGQLAGTNQIRLAQLAANPGFVLDYATVDTDQSDYTFEAGATYYLSSGVTFTGNVTIEAGTVIKFPANSNSFLYAAGGAITCEATPDAPAIFTSKDDDSAGERIDGSTGSPVVGDYVCLGAENMAIDVHDMKMLYGFWGIFFGGGSANIRNVQIMHSQIGVEYYLSTNSLRNALMSDIREWAFEGSQSTVDVEHLTLDQCPQLGFDDYEAFLQFTNCLFTGVATMPPGGGFNIPYVSNSIVILSTNTGVFQSAAAASYYLSSSSGYRNIGTTNINPDLWTGLQAMTTYAPQDGGFPDTNAPDIGYHYSANEDSDFDGLPDWWEYYWFGTYVHTGSELDANGNTLLSDYQNYANGTVTNDPNIINFTIDVPNNYVTTSSPTMGMNVSIGTPAYYSVLVDSTNYAGASWTGYTSSNLTASIGSTQGWHEIWVGLKGPAPGATVTWVWKRLKLDTTAPTIVITNPPSSTVNVPMIQICGYSTEDLDTISCDVSNALGVVTNLDAGVTDRHHDTNAWEFTTNYFECLDVPLTNGVNVVRIYATDLAGNVTTLATNITLDYTGKVAPIVQLTWPQDGTMLCGSNFTIRGQVDDPTVSLTATIISTNGSTNTVYGKVERNGRFWVDSVPLNAGTNQVSIVFSNTVSQTTVTNFNVAQSAMTLTMNDVGDPMQLWQPTINLSGTISDTSAAIQVNGVTGTNNGDGTWNANHVPVPAGGVAIFDVKAIPAGEDPDISINLDKPARLYLDSYTESDGGSMSDTGPNSYQYSYTRAGSYTWNDGVGGRGALSTSLSISDASEWTMLHGNAQLSSPAASWPVTVAGTNNSSGDYSDSSPYSSTNSDTLIWGPMLLGEHWVAKSQVDENKWPIDFGLGSWGWAYADTLSGNFHRTAESVWKLQTGGRGFPDSQSVFELSASLYEMVDPLAEPLLDSSEAEQPINDYDYGDLISWTGSKSSTPVSWAISPTSITIGGKALNADGKAYQRYADNTTQDVTPKAKGKDRYIGSPGAQKYTLVHLTHYPSLGDTNRARLNLGVGEEVDFSGMPDVTVWSTSAGGLSATNGGGMTFTAPSNQMSATVTATLPNLEPINTKFDVKKPQGLLKPFVLSTNHYPVGTIGAGMGLQLVITPINVSFYRITVLEFATNAVNITGYFTNFNTTNLTLSFGSQNVSWQNVFFDDVSASLSSYTPPLYPGGYEYDVPTAWQIGSSQTNMMFTPSSHFKLLNSSGDFSADKYGTTVTRTTNDVITVN